MGVFKIAPRVSLADMRCEGASVLRCLVIENVVAEIVVAKRIRTKGRIILRRSKIDWCACA